MKFLFLSIFLVSYTFKMIGPEDVNRAWKEIIKLSGKDILQGSQVISETLPIDSREKKFLDGFLFERENLLGQIKDRLTQGRLF